MHDDFVDRFNNPNVGSAINFFVDEPGATAGTGAYAAGNIFMNLPRVFGNADRGNGPETTIQLVDNLIDPMMGDFGVANRPGTILDLGSDNLLAAASFENVTDGDFSLAGGVSSFGLGPFGQDHGALVPKGAWVAGEPAASTSSDAASLVVGGPGIFAYRYRVNGGTWSDDISIGNGFDRGGNTVRTASLELNNLSPGQYTVEVLGQDYAGVWQTEPTVSRTWEVTSPEPNLVINEVLAEGAEVGRSPDLIELYNAGESAINLQGMSLTDDLDRPSKFVFDEARILRPGEYLVVTADSGTSAGVHTGFSLRRGGDRVYLFDTVANGQSLIDSVVFGIQIPGMSIGRVGPAGQWALNTPSLGEANAMAPTGGPSELVINEWFAAGDSLLRDDFIELYNPSPLPVDLGGLYLTDELGGSSNQHEIAPLSFIAANDYARFIADGNEQAGGDHLNFRLSTDQEELALLTSDSRIIDTVFYFPQTVDVSQGRTPNGGTSFAFFALPTPGGPNPQPTTSTRSIIEIGDTWSYDNSGTNLRSSWRRANFDASAWESGPGPLGNEREPLAEPIATEFNLGTPTNPTFYFRKSFTVDFDPATAIVQLQTQIDDGAIVYINEQEVLRLGMPNGRVGYTTTANRAVNEAQFEGPFTVPTSALQRGENLIAVEVHQTSLDSRDLVFGLSMSAEITADDHTVENARTILDGLRVTEVNYHPFDIAPTEFIELQNVSDQPLELQGVRIRGGVDFTFPEMTLDPSEFTVVVQDVSAFAQRYGAGVNIAGQYGNGTDGQRLSNAGEQLRLEDALQRTIQEFAYNDGGDWPGRADGGGSSLQVTDVLGDANDADNWHASSLFGGSPGTVGTHARLDVVVNEVLAHTDPPQTDTIELFNTGGQSVDVGGWFLSDTSQNYRKYRIPDGTVLPAGGYVTFDESQFNANPDVGSGGFALSSARGDDVWLIEADTQGNLLRFADHVEFGASANGVPMGRWPNGGGELFPMSSLSLGRENSGPQAGPVIISEVHYHAVDPDGSEPSRPNDFEFVELYNRTSSAVDLSNWRLTGGIDYVFDRGTLLLPHETLTVVTFDPGDFLASSIFRVTMNADNSAELVGPYSGRLNNGGETIRLERPDDPPVDDPSFVPYILVDRVAYDELAPWPTEAGGQGSSLNRDAVLSFGDVANSWTAQPPTPGQAEFARERQAGDANEDFQFDQFDIIAVLQSAKYLTGQAATWAEGDWNEDGVFSQFDIIAALQTGNYLQGPYAARDELFARL